MSQRARPSDLLVFAILLVVLAARGDAPQLACSAGIVDGGRLETAPS